MRNSFDNANEAYEALLDEVVINGMDFDNTKLCLTVGFILETLRTII